MLAVVAMHASMTGAYDGVYSSVTRVSQVAQVATRPACPARVQIVTYASGPEIRRLRTVTVLHACRNRAAVLARSSDAVVTLSHATDRPPGAHRIPRPRLAHHPPHR